MFRILHISDLHFGRHYLPDVGTALLQLAADLEPQVVVASGDFTQRAKRAEFTAARDFLGRLPNVPRVVVPGNHDVPLYRVAERLLAPHQLYREYIFNELNTVLTMDQAVFLGLDSTAPHRAITNGRIRRCQLDFCRQALANAPPDAVRIVVAHHHFAPAPDYLRDQTLPRARRAINQFIDLGVEMILGGHLHRAYVGNTLDVHRGKRPDRGVIVVQCGTSTSRRGRGRERQKNSLNLIALQGDMIQITHFLYFDAERAFAPIGRYLFPRPGKRFVDPLETPAPVADLGSPDAGCLQGHDVSNRKSDPIGGSGPARG